MQRENGGDPCLWNHPASAVTEKSFEQLGRHDCQFATSPHAARPHIFCGAPKVDGKPYCLAHCKEAYYAPRAYHQRKKAEAGDPAEG